MPTLAEQWIEQGRVKGREGLREATLKILRRYLVTRFGVSQGQFDAAFARLDLAALTRLSDAAFEAASLAEFETMLAEVTASSPPDVDSDPETPAP